MALAFGFALFAPVFIAWNMDHDWSVVRYHLSQRHKWSTDLGWRPLIYVGEHAGAWSPVLFCGVWAAFVGAGRAWRRGDRRSAWPLAFGVVPILFFLGPNLLTQRKLMSLQWDEIGYAAGIIALAGIPDLAAGEAGGCRWRRTRLAALGVAVALTVVIAAAVVWPAFGASLRLHSIAQQTFGWKEAARRLQELEGRWPAKPPVVVGESFRTALCMAYHLGRLDYVYTLDSRWNERYGLRQEITNWKMDEARLREHAGGQAIYVLRKRPSKKDSTEENLRGIDRYFTTVELVNRLDVPTGGEPVWSFLFFRCHN
jgi:hypothetical protein